MQIYVVRPGDTIDTIGEAADMEPLRIAFDNQIEYPYRLAVGQALLLTGESSRAADMERSSGNGNMIGLPVSDEKWGPVWMNGYAYPWIDQQVLSETCRYLTSISIFSYGFTVNGDLIPPDSKGEENVLEEARRQEVIPSLVLTPLGADGHFNNNLVSALVRNLGVQQKLIRNLWETAEAKGYGEINIDFEYVLAEDRELLVDFVRRLRIIMNLFGIRVTVALAPKTSGSQRGLLYEGIDYRALGEAADAVLLMTYEWGYTYEPTNLR